MAHTVFFSWQSDTPDDIGREFLSSILEEVCSDLANDTTLDKPSREVSLDRDIKNVPGQPPLAQTIFDKISRASVFVADMTFVGDRRNGKGPIPNPNVLIEHGYALRDLTHSRLIYVMNTAYGTPGGENMPFDLRHVLHPIVYDLSQDASVKQIKESRDILIDKLRTAIRACLAVTPVASTTSAEGFIPKKALNGPAYFREPAKEVGIIEEMFFARGDKPKKLFLTNGAAAWLRVMPQVDLGRKLLTTELKGAVKPQGVNHFNTLISRSGGYGFVRAADGMGKYYADGATHVDDRVLDVGSLVYLFNTGELWSIESYLLKFATDRIPNMESVFKDALLEYITLLESVGIPGPYKWSVGMTGLEGRRMTMPEPPPGRRWISELGDVCLVDTVEYHGVYDSKTDNVADALRPFFVELYDSCGMERPTHLD